MEWITAWCGGMGLLEVPESGPNRQGFSDEQVVVSRLYKEYRGLRIKEQLIEVAIQVHTMEEPEDWVELFTSKVWRDDAV